MTAITFRAEKKLSVPLVKRHSVSPEEALAAIPSSACAPVDNNPDELQCPRGQSTNALTCRLPRRAASLCCTHYVALPDRVPHQFKFSRTLFTLSGNFFSCPP
jgi:hypothetical protein